MPPPLIESRWRVGAMAAGAAAAALVVLLSIMLHHARSTALDTWAFAEFNARNGTSPALLGVTDPWMSTGLLAGVAVIALLARRRDVAILAVVAPLLALGVTEWLLKPLIGRGIGPGVHLAGATVRGSFPSGHETGVASTAAVLFVVAGQAALTRVARIAVAAVLAGWVVLAAVGLVVNRWHYLTDAVGAIAVSTVAVSATALLIDLVPRRGRGTARATVSAAGGRRAS